MDFQTLSKIWYFFYFGSIVCVWPYLNLLYRANGLDDAQIGVLAAIKPWVSAPSSFLWSGLADRFSLHKSILLATFVVSTLTRTSTVAAHSFGAFMLLAAAGEFVAAPVGVMADAAVVAGCRQDTDYGKSRLWGAVAWGGLSTFSGWLVSSYGMPSGFAAYLLLSVPCVFCAARMEFNLGKKQQQLSQQQQHGKSAQQQSGGGAGQVQSSGSGGVQQQQQHEGGEHEVECDTAELADGDLEQQPLVQHRDHSSSKAGLANQAPSLERAHFQQQQNQKQYQQQQLQQQQQHSDAGPDAVGFGQVAVGVPVPAVSEGCLQLQLGSSSSESGGSGADVLVLPDVDTQPDPAAVSKAVSVDPLLLQQQHSQLNNDWQQQQQHQHHIALAVDPQASSSSSPDYTSSSRMGTAAAGPTSPHGAAQPPPPAPAPSSDLQPPQPPQPQQPQQQQPPDFWHSLVLLLRRPEVLIFMGQATAMGFGIGVIGEFLFLFLQELGGSETLMGLTLTFTCLAEVPIFHYQGTVLRYISVHTMLHIVMWTYAIRLGLYALLPFAHSPWAVLPVELLHGITFACGWGAGTINSKRVAPPELAATMQGIFQGLYFGVGQGLGALIGGVLKERFGGQAMFAMCAAIIMGAWLLVVAAEVLTGSSTSSSQSCQKPTCASSCSGSSWAAADDLQDACAGTGMQGRHQHDSLGGGRVQQQQRSWWSWVRQLAAGGAAASRSRRQAYLELGSKDSGPDLAALRQ